jgi:hypothetical protein
MLPTLIPSLICLFFASTAASVHKRANAQNTLTIPVTIDANGRYTVPTDMVRSYIVFSLIFHSLSINFKSSGAALQSFAFALSTSSSYTAVAGTGCDSCGGAPQLVTCRRCRSNDPYLYLTSLQI